MPQTLVNADVDDNAIELPDVPELDDQTTDDPGTIDPASNDQPVTGKPASTSTPSQPHTDAPTAADIAFNMFDSAKLNEPALLAELQVDRAGYEPDERLSLRALKAVEEGRLSQDAMIKVLGSH